MKLTAGELRKKLDGISDETPVYIERIHDIYFDKYDWKTENIVFRRDESGEAIDETDIIQASSSGCTKKRVVIYAHI